MEKCWCKICDLFEEVICCFGFKNGMMIFFYYVFCGGDKVVNMVMVKLVEMGFCDLMFVFSLLIDVYWLFIEYIKNGVVWQIYIFGLCGKLGEEIFVGLMENLVQIYFYGGCVKLIQSGELNIDVVFFGVLCCDEFGNVNGFSGKLCCGFLGYVQVDVQYVKCVVFLIEEWVEFFNYLVSIVQDQVDLIVQVDEVGDLEKIIVGVICLFSNLCELLIVWQVVNVIEYLGYFCDGFLL